MDRTPGTLRRIVLPALFAQILLGAFYFTAPGQPVRSISSTGRRIDEINKQAEKAQRDQLTREMRGRRPSEEELKQQAARKARITRDLEGLQTEYNKIVEKLNVRESMAEEFVMESAERIHEHASRLRHDLIFPERSKDETQQAAQPEQAANTAVSLRGLCLQIHAFITNPALENPVVVDVKESERARDTLDKIIQISDLLRRSSKAG